jgi:hypothetical protein
VFESLETVIQANQEHSGSFMYWSVSYYWIRELLLARKSRNWTPVEGIVEFTHRTKGGYKKTVRAEVRYSYRFDSQGYMGRVVRDTCWSFRPADRLVDDHVAGGKILVRVNPDKPNQSYFPSGFGWVEPFVTLLLSFLGTLLLVSITIGVGILPLLKRHS